MKKNGHGYAKSAEERHSLPVAGYFNFNLQPGKALHNRAIHHPKAPHKHQEVAGI